MSDPLKAAGFVIAHVSQLSGDFAHHAIPMFDDDLPVALEQYAERHQRNPTQRPYYVLPLGLLAWYAAGHDPKEWPGH